MQLTSILARDFCTPLYTVCVMYLFMLCYGDNECNVSGVKAEKQLEQISVLPLSRSEAN